MDKFSKKKRSEIMSRVRSTNTKFEKVIFKEIRKSGIRFRSHYVGIIGKPDIALPKAKKAVFLHSDFWHGWRLSSWENILPSDFWKSKLQKNRIRDQFVVRKLRKEGWLVLVVWEHQINQSSEDIIKRIVNFLSP